MAFITNSTQKHLNNGLKIKEQEDIPFNKALEQVDDVQSSWTCLKTR